MSNTKGNCSLKKNYIYICVKGIAVLTSLLSLSPPVTLNNILLAQGRITYIKNKTKTKTFPKWDVPVAQWRKRMLWVPGLAGQWGVRDELLTSEPTISEGPTCSPAIDQGNHCRTALWRRRGFLGIGRVPEKMSDESDWRQGVEWYCYSWS